MIEFVVRAVASGGTFWFAGVLVPQIDVGSNWGAVLVVSVVVGLVNALIRPVAERISLPMTGSPLALATLVVNSSMLIAIADFSDTLSIDNFTSAILAAAVISLVSWPLSIYLTKSWGRSEHAGDGTGGSSEPLLESGTRYQVAGDLLLAGVAATLLGASANWTSSDEAVDGLMSQSTNGWIPLLSAALALGVYNRFVEGKLPAILALALISLGSLGRILSGRWVEGFERDWVWWVALGGGFSLLAAAGLALGIRLSHRKEHPFQRPRRPA
jgi:putative membrane protein